MARIQHGCLPGAEAERRIHAYARSGGFELAYTRHAKIRMKERSVSARNVRYILAHGGISDEPEATARAGYCKYKLCGGFPGSDKREACLVVILARGKPVIKIITVMWRDSQ